MKVVVKTSNLTREEWLKYRTKGIGGSDVSIIAGINPFKSVHQLWLEKTGQAVAMFTVACTRSYIPAGSSEPRELTDFIPCVAWGNSGENNGKHTVIYLKDTITGEELRFGSLSSCERYLNNMGFYFSRRTYEDCAKKNRYYGIQNRLFGKYIFRFDGDSFL